MNRKLLAAREDLVKKIAQIAKRKNLTLFAFINETLEQLLKSEEKGVPLPQIVEEYFILKTAKEAGFNLTPESLFHGLLEKVFQKDDRALREAWRDMGGWFGKYFKTLYSNQDSLKLIEKVMRTILWEASDFSLTKDGEEVYLRCIGSRCPASHTLLLSALLSGFMEAFDYTPVRKDLARGIISLTFVKRRE
ncbi:hypothetical protein [Candidatus Hecatella orcuttiae]|uniref:hypothetical protein n=1 Tax=Candidatus Hecatella orcuttiae TaxID=1935119 RepID=UPI002867D9BB|nr:hypothetical protein [Candidatus Hecatella orcuttiae]